MREIKFRAWEETRKIMFDPSVMDLMIDFKGDVFSVDIGEYERVDDLKIMQYTGLKDMDGKDIYEGDIVEHSECVDENTVDGPYMGTEVVFEDSMFCFKHDCPNPLSIYVDLKVIGNIYENPELLDSKKP